MINRDCRNLLRSSAAARKVLVYGALGGIVFSMMQFGEVIARKSLGASELQVTLMTMAMPVTSLTSIWWGRILIGRDQRAILWIFGIFGLLAMATGVFLVTFEHLFIMFLIYFAAFALQGTAQNRALQQHIPPKQTGGLFGLAQGMRMFFAAILSAFAGWWLEVSDKGWQELFPSVALVGLISLAALAAIRTGMNTDAAPLKIKYWMISPLKDAAILLKKRPDYFRFEIAFMIYGVAFMMTLPVVPIFLVDDLQMTYAQIGITRGTAFQVVMIGSVPFFGRVFDRSTPHRMAVWAFSILSLYPLLLLSAKYFDGTIRFLLVLSSFMLFGFALGSIMLIWNLSSMRFTGPGEDAGHYQSVHIAATGVRGLFAPLLGYAVMKTFGNEVALAAAAAVWLLSALAMAAARFYDIKKGGALSLRVK